MEERGKWEEAVSDSRVNPAKEENDVKFCMNFEQVNPTT